MAADKTSKEMAEALGLTVSAVNSHRLSLRRKFGVSTAAGLMVAAMRAGLID